MDIEHLAYFYDHYLETRWIPDCYNPLFEGYFFVYLSVPRSPFLRQKLLASFQGNKQVEQSLNSFLKGEKSV